MKKHVKILNHSFAGDKLKQDLLQQIQEDFIQPEQAIMPEHSLAKKYGISYMTVRKVTDELTAKGLLYRIRGKGTFVAKSAKVRNSRKTGNIGFIFCTNFGKLFSDPFMVEIFNGIQKESSNRKFRINAFSVDEENQKKPFLPDFIKEKHVKGILVMGLITPEYIIVLKKKNLPMVLIDNHIIEGVDSILTDNLNSAFKALEHLYNLGHRRIGCIYAINPCLPHLLERLKGYKLAIDTFGLKYDDSLVQQVDFISDKGYLAMKNILKNLPLPTAIFAGNDIIAINAMRAIRENNLKIPKDISIIGFDDIESAVHTEPPLTTMKVRKKEMGEMAADKLLDIIEKKTDKPSHIRMMAELIERDSCRKI